MHNFTYGKIRELQVKDLGMRYYIETYLDGRLLKEFCSRRFRTKKEAHHWYEGLINTWKDRKGE